MPVPDPPADDPGEGGPPGVFLVSPDVVPGVEEGARFGFVARGSPSWLGPQPATMIDRMKTMISAMETFFICGFKISSKA